MTQVNYYGFNQLSQSLHFRKRQYDPNTQSVPDESFLNGDARDVQPGRGYLFDGVDSQIQIITSNQGTLYVSAQLKDGSLDSNISITYDTDRYKIEKTNNEAIQNIKVWTVSNATTAEKKSKELESNLFAWFKCDEASLDDSFDSSGNDNDGKIANASLSTFHTTSDKFYSWQNNVGYTYDSVNDRYIPRDESDTDKDVQGNNLQYKAKVPYTSYAKDSNCGKFNGVDSYVNIGDQSALKQNAVSVTCWVRVNNSSNFQDIIAQDTINNNYGYRLFYSKKTQTIRFGINNQSGGSATYVDSSNPINTGEWYFVAGTWDGTTIKFYLNSNFEDSKPITEIFHGGDILFGNNSIGGSFPLEGNLSDVRIFDYELTQTQINYIYNNGDKQSPEAVGRWAFSEGNDNFVYDVSGNGYHGEIKNASITDFWSERQDQFHYNIEHGFDLWVDGSGNKLYVPFDENGNSIKTQGDTISGFSWDSKHEPSTNFHNGAETRFDTDANDPHFGNFKRAVSDTGIHPSKNVSGNDRYYIRKLTDDEADRFTLYLNDQVDPQKLKTEIFTQ